MPNGGSDCCGTCWFNSKDKGEAGYAHANGPGEDRCLIRDLVITNPFWTYCANHPHHNPRKVDTPVGPVYVCEIVAPPVRGGMLHGDAYQRKVWADSPDTEEIRQIVVRLLEALPEKPEEEYPTETKFDYELIRQVGAFREQRAARGLRRVLAFNPDVNSGGDFSRDRRVTVGYALESLAQILGDAALEDVEKFLRYGVGSSAGQERNAVLRYFAVKALAHCSPEQAASLLDQAANDPHSEVAACARDMINRAGRNS